MAINFTLFTLLVFFSILCKDLPGVNNREHTVFLETRRACRLCQWFHRQEQQRTFTSVRYRQEVTTPVNFIFFLCLLHWKKAVCSVLLSYCLVHVLMVDGKAFAAQLSTTWGGAMCSWAAIFNHGHPYFFLVTSFCCSMVLAWLIFPIL